MLGVNSAIGHTTSLTPSEDVFELAVKFEGEFLERQN